MAKINKMVPPKKQRSPFEFLPQRTQFGDIWDETRSYTMDDLRVLAERIREDNMRYRKTEIDPNSPDGIMELEHQATQSYLRRPFVLCMSKATWNDLINPEAKEYIVQQMDEGELEVEITQDCPDRAIYIKEKDSVQIPDYL